MEVLAPALSDSMYVLVPLDSPELAVKRTTAFQTHVFMARALTPLIPFHVLATVDTRVPIALRLLIYAIISPV